MADQAVIDARRATGWRTWRSSRKARGRISRAITYALIIFGAVIIFFPFYWQIATSLKSPEEVFRWPPIWIPFPPRFENYIEVMTVVPMRQYVTNSLFISLSVVFGTVLSCSLAAYGFARLRFPGRDVLFIILITPMILPWAVTVVPQFILFQKLGWYNSYRPLIVPAFFGSPFFIFMLRQFLMTIPLELEDAARIDGAGFLQTYARIIIPLSKPALATVAIFSFMGTWNDFFGPLIYLSDQRKFTLPLGLAFFQGSPRSAVQIHLLMATAVIIAIPCVVVYFLAQRLFIQGIVFTGIKG
jgi:multiple sugar transport system permease protein/sn-glycerol 3-phosphate transport system permease protein